MDIYNQTINQALDQNEISELKWIKYQDNVKETRETLNTFLKSYKLDIMVPIGKKAFIRGTLEHTNDLLISHGANHFSHTSNFQANNILEHRDKVCVQRLKELDQEKALFRGKLDIPGNDAFSEHEIIEEYDEAAEKEWRLKHIESVKRYKQKEAEERKTRHDNEINNLLDKYELIEEVAGELERLQDDADYEALLKLISEESSARGTNKKRIAHPPVNAIHEKNRTNDQKNSGINKSGEETVPDEVIQKSADNKKGRRKVRFSTSLEDVKIIESLKISKEEEQSVAFPALQIKFHHSSGKFNPMSMENDADVEFKHPGEILNVLSKVHAEPKKSILKETNYVYQKAPEYPKLEDEEIFGSLSKFPLICGDVIERTQDNSSLKSIVVSPEKKVSKFRVLRSKLK